MKQIKGVKRVCMESKMIPNGYHIQISLDSESNELISSLHSNNNWSIYHKDSIIHIMNVTSYMTMKEIINEVEYALYLKEIV